MWWVLLLFLLLARFRSGSSQTNSQDVNALQALMSNWKNEPQSWTGSTDPCTSWDGISCSNERVTEVRLPSMNIGGKLSNVMGQLSALTYLHLSNNPSLGGPLTPSIGDLKQLTNLILLGCNFTGNIPQEIGNLRQLALLALNSNQFTGRIPPALGFLTNLSWLDLSANQLSGQIPVSTNSDPGLDKLVNTKYFHFSENMLTGPMNRNLFSANMSLVHVIFDNKFTGSIPDSLGLIKTLQIIRLDHNQFNGPVPNSIGNLPNLTELSLASNQLNRTVPDLTNATNLHYVDTSNNNFASSPAPQWISTLTSLNTIFMDNDGLTGPIPSALFSFPQMQQISLSNNVFGELLDMRGTISSQLRVINLINNHIFQTELNPSYTNSLILTRNPVCLDNLTWCTVQQKHQVAYSTSPGPCGDISCPANQLANPAPSQSCTCTNPFQGLMIFRAPAFSDMTNPTIFQQLESTLAQDVSLAPGSVAVSDVEFSPGAPLKFTLKFFPVSGTNFNPSEVIRISSALVNQIYKAPPAFGPYSFVASKYSTSPSDKNSSTQTGVILGIAVAGTIEMYQSMQCRKRTFTKIMQIVLTSAAASLLFPCIYFLIWQRKGKILWFLLCKKTSNSTERNYEAMIVSYGTLAPKRYMYSEVIKITSSRTDQLGKGGYGVVFKGRLHDGRLVAVKFLHDCKGNGDDFVNEVMSIGRTSHVNVVSLFGFCLEVPKRALIYEYMSNGSLAKYIYSKNPKETLGWERLYSIAIGIARGLEYLHHSCNTRIVHFDIKPQNILLDKDFSPKIADFGLAKLCHTKESKISITGARGTIGFIAPEVHSRTFGAVSTKSDVYSYGMMLLEMVGGRRNIKSIVEKSSEKYFPDWIYDHFAQEDGLQACEVTGEIEEIARKMTFIGLWCIQVIPVYRPTITKVLEMFERSSLDDLDMPPKQNFSEPLESSTHNLDVQSESSTRPEEISLVDSKNPTTTTNSFS